MPKLILITLFTLNLNYADELLDREMNIAVPLIDEAQEVDEILNARVHCPSLTNEEKNNLEKEVPPCDPQVSANGTGNPVNTSIVDLRRIVSEAQARCPNCRQGGGFTGPDFDDELQRRRMNDARNRNRRGDRTDWSTVNQIPPRYMQTLVPGYPLNYSDPVIGNDLKKVHDQIRNPIEGCNIRDEARFASGAFLAQASESAGAGDYEEAKAFLKVAKDLADFATGVVPGISEARDAYEFFTGKDAFTGEPLSDSGRALAGLGMIPFLGGAIKGGKALVKLAKFAGKRFPKIYKTSVKAAERAGRIYNNAFRGKWGEAFKDVNPSDLLKGKVNKRLVEKLRTDKGIPKSWNLEKSVNGNGVRFHRPGTNKADEIRFMPGNPSNPNPTSQKPYVRIKKDGRFRDINGNVTDNPDLSHIPMDDFLKIPDIF